jgi:glutamate 5-kinase
VKKNIRRIVIKIGSSLFFSKAKGFDQALFDDFISQAAGLAGAGREIIIVSSGAIALGMGKLGLKTRPRELAMLQAAAAVGQNILMDKYRRGFKDLRIEAQLLLTWEDFNDRTRYLNAKNTLATLLKLGIIPVINENDTVATDEIRFGDNDRLSALVAAMVAADLLIILTDVDGLLDSGKKLTRRVAEITGEVRGWACPTDKQTCVGGMITKIDAAKIAVESGIPCVIANGRIRGNVSRIAKDPFCGGDWTLFEPQKRMAERERWIAFGSKPKGTVLVDEGARKALLNNKSLLSVGVVGVCGTFGAGDVVCIADSGGVKLGAGKVSVDSATLEKIKGSRHEREIVHRDNIVIMRVTI